MNILAVESSCDETAVAIVRDGREVLCDCIASQVALHREYGGVVPEIASRRIPFLLCPGFPVLPRAYRFRLFPGSRAVSAAASSKGCGLPCIPPSRLCAAGCGP